MMTMITKCNKLRVLESVCGIVACCYLVFKLLVYDDYQLMWHKWCNAESWQWITATVALIMIVPNLMLEATKWKLLLAPMGKRTLKDAFKDVCKGTVGAFITPNRVGEFPYRAIYLPPSWRISAIALGGMGSMIQMVVISMIGLPTLCALCTMLPVFDWENTILRLLILLILIIIGCVLLAKLKTTQKAWKELLLALNKLSGKETIGVILCTFGRYATFCTQFWLMLESCGVSLSWEQALMAIPTYYFLVTFTPSINVAELAVRGSWAVIALSPFTSDTPAVTLAAGCVWLINGVTPMIIGLLLKKTNLAMDDSNV